MALSLIIFDCDGVILESVDAKSRAFRRIGLDYGEEAADMLSMFHSMHGGVSRMIKFEWFFKEVLKQPLTEERKQQLNERFIDYCYDEIRSCIMVPGMQDMLDTWHKRIPMYVASGAPHHELQTIMKERGLDTYFEGVFGSPPNKSTLLYNIIKAAGVPAADTIMIGDSQTDLTAAEAVHCGFYGRGEYFRNSGYPWFHDLTKLNAHLEQLAAEN